jgi:multiple sugar transport system ATP-binding protein
MAELQLAGVSKSYGKKQALSGVDLAVSDGEFFVILGPSGAGKTTTLKSVAGLEEIDEGTVRIGGVDMTGVEPYHRNVAMAFESYALYPQKTVYDNLASPLRSGRTGTYSAAQQRERIEAVTGTLGILPLLQRFPRELSNGQRQRVALGRVLVRPAGAYLLDEPLSHLDAKLRAAMRAELKQLGAMSSTTTLYVTHDYQEALALGDRIAVLREGRIVQIGTPREIWEEPADTFVARSLGQPEINLVTRDGTTLGMRPSQFRLVEDHPVEDHSISFDGAVLLAERLGRQVELTVRTGDDTELVAVVASDGAPREGDTVSLSIRRDDVHVFDESGRRTGCLSR